MFVCRQWHHALSTRSLLYDIELDSDSKFDSFIDMAQRFYSRASQVEILKIRGGIKRPIDNRKFCNMFPNLRVFTFGTYATSALGKHFDKPSELMLPDTKLEKTKDDGECKLTRQLIMASSCTKLKSLELDLCDFDNPRQNIDVHMKIMPVLTKLALFYCNIGIQDCEILHSNIPTLQIFSLKYVTLDPGKLPKNITSTTSVTQLLVYFERVVNSIEYPNWYIYMAKKYTNLERLVCSDLVIQGVDPNQATVIYRDGMLPLYKNIGKRIFYFDAKNVPTELEIFKQLDDFGCRFSVSNLAHNGTRHIFTQLAQSNQAKYVKQLEIEHSIITSPSLFQNMKNLTRLRIDTKYGQGYWPIDLTEYLNAFPPTLIEFLIHCTDLEISKLPTYKSNIEKLLINCGILSEELVNLISDFFPELYGLCLIGGVEENMTIDLSSNYLEKLSLETYYEQLPHGFSVDSTDSSPVKYYVWKRNLAVYSSYTLKPATAEELQDRVTINIKYHAEQFNLSTTSSDDRL